MTSAILGPAFPTWRDIWTTDTSIRDCLERIDRLRAIRAQGNFSLPTIPKADRTRLQACFIFVKNTLNSFDHTTVALAAASSEFAMRALDPILPSVRWGRWLFLEKALEQAMLSGDLLFAAVILRSLGEELLRLRSLQYGKGLSQSSLLEDVKAWAAAVYVGIEPLMQDHSGAKLDQSEYFDRSLSFPEDEMIKIRMRELNDYVHPNYGSHILALYPETAQGCAIILSAYEMVLTEFLALPWATETDGIVGTPISAPCNTNFRGMEWRFNSRMMTTIKSHATSTYKVKEFDPASFLSWLKSPDTEYNDLLTHDELVTTLEALVPSRGEKKNYDNNEPNITVNNIKELSPWRIKSVKIFAQLALARRTEKWLSTEFPNGSPSDFTSGQWFLFASRSLELFAATTALKIEAFKVQLFYQLVDRNLLGIAACMRALSEHLASSEWLFHRLFKHWEAVQRKTLSSGEIPADVTHQFQNDLSRLLSGTMGSLEQQAPWAKIRSGINVSSAVELAFDDTDILRSEYHFSSAALHGRLMRSLELCAPKKNYEDNICFRAVRCLDDFCHRDLNGDHLAQSLVLQSQLLNVARTVSNIDRVHRHALIQAVGAVTKLKFGRDFTGSGLSEADPIVFLGPLYYYAAFRRYCEQEDLDPTRRQLQQDASGTLLDVVQTDAGAVWFKVDQASFDDLSDFIDPKNP